MRLRLIRIVRREEKYAPSCDERRRVNCVVAEYQGEDGHEYRKSFESYGEPVVPESGTHAELNSQQIQWSRSPKPRKATGQTAAQGNMYATAYGILRASITGMD